MKSHLFAVRIASTIMAKDRATVTEMAAQLATDADCDGKFPDLLSRTVYDLLNSAMFLEAVFDVMGNTVARLALVSGREQDLQAIKEAMDTETMD